MKYISFIVPCYNSQEYLERCVRSLLPGGEDVEILIVNDGSTDATGEIGERLAKSHPGIVRVVHKPNGGHGSGINLGLKLAVGLYFKVVDSDDWLEEGALGRLLEYLKSWTDKVSPQAGTGGDVSDGEKEDGAQVADNPYFLPKGDVKHGGVVCASDVDNNPPSLPDLVVCNYVYDHLEEGIGKVMAYRNVFPEGEFCSWEQTGRFGPSQYLVMHALLFRTELLRKAGVELPEHTFYVDNLFSCKPLPLVERICYLDLNLYHYYLGREDQSVNEKVMISRIDQLIRVTELAAGCIDLKEVERVHPRLAVYLRRNISIMLAMTSIHLLLMNSEEGMGKRTLLWEGLKQREPGLYRTLRFRTLSGLTYLPGKWGRFLTLAGYRLAKRIYRFQ